MSTAKWIITGLLIFRTLFQTWTWGGGLDKHPVPTWRTIGREGLVRTLLTGGLLWWAGFWR